SQLCHWHVPEAHCLESWGDTRAFDGTVTIMQPLIAPLYNGKSAYEVLAALTARPELSSYEIVRAYWQSKNPGAGFETFWRQSVHDGFVANSALPPKTMSAAAGAAAVSAGNAAQQGPAQQRAVTDATVISQPAPATPSQPPPSPGELEIIFRPDPAIYDGRFVNNGWLQELPRSITRLTWDNAAMLGRVTGNRLGVSDDDARTGGDSG